MSRIESNWISFNQEWGKHYQNAKHILAYMNSYPKVLSTLRMKKIHNPDTIDDAQIEWIWLCSKFDNMLEIDFFKSYWIPLEVNSYDYFMDISDENYPIFDINYFFYEPYRWYKKFVSEDIRDILLSPDTGLDLWKIIDRYDKKRWQQVDEFFKERKLLGYQGKINVEPVNYLEIALNDSESKLLIKRIGKSKINISGVTAIVAGLLPFDLLISVKDLKYKGREQIKTLGEVKNIRDFVFFMRESGMRSIESYRIDFPGLKYCYLEYRNSSCFLKHIDFTVTDRFADSASKLNEI